MARFYGAVGYSMTEETKPGVYTPVIVTRNYSGDILRNVQRRNGAEKVNEDIHVSNQISIVADAYAYQNFHAIVFVTFMGVNWKVTEVEVEYPRLKLTLGGVYNGEL